MLSKEVVEKWMRVANQEGQKAAERGDEPFGAVLLDKDGNLYVVHLIAKIVRIILACMVKLH